MIFYDLTMYSHATVLDYTTCNANDIVVGHSSVKADFSIALCTGIHHIMYRSMKTCPHLVTRLKFNYRVSCSE